MTIDGQNVNVRFFGDHTHSDLPAINCYLYSKNTPGRPRSSSNQYNAAVKVSYTFILYCLNISLGVIIASLFKDGG